jgi:exodeoxyribonuclease VII large subunit
MVNQEIDIYTLSELASKVKASLTDAFPSVVLVKAEISQISVNTVSGHCYMDLIEKSSVNDAVIAKIRANIWRNNFRDITFRFERVAGTPLANGITIMAVATVEYNELYGLSLNVKDIDPNYTLGDMARRRAEIINTLRNEGIFDMNKMLPFPVLPRRIAVISSETAAGYEDFIRQLEDNKEGYILYTKLFQAVMQGSQTEESIIGSLDFIADEIGFFDCVVIIRGGGATSDLQAFDSLNLSRICAQFPLPVLTGIGHTRDESVLDMVAYRALKTPTAVAEYLIERMSDAETNVDELAEKLNEVTMRLLLNAQNILIRGAARLPQLFMKQLSLAEAAINSAWHDVKRLSLKKLDEGKFILERSEDKIKRSVKQKLSNDKTSLDTIEFAVRYKSKNIMTRAENILFMTEQRVKYLNPAILLRRGYTLTEHEDRIVTSANMLKKGDIIKTHFADGDINSIVNEL